MNKIAKVLLVVVMALCIALTVVACDNNDLCKDGHSWDNGTVTKAATCVEKGVKTFNCQNCSETKTEDVEVDATNHKGPEVAIDPVSPDCENAGSKDGKKCSACDAVIVEPVTDPAKGHNYDESKYSSDAKQHFYVCKDCGAKKDAADHDCVENVCSVCNKELTESEVLEVLYSLKDSKTALGTYKLTGMVTKINTPYNPEYKNIEVTMKVAGKDVVCYRMLGTEDCPLDADTIKVGQTITVSGGLKYIYGKREFDMGCKLLKIEYTESNINVKIENGTTSLPKTARNDSLVEFTVTPNEGFRIEEVYFNGKRLTESEGKYSFKMLGDASVTVVIVPSSQKLSAEIVKFDFADPVTHVNNAVENYYSEWSTSVNDYTLKLDSFYNYEWKGGWQWIRAGHKQYDRIATMSIDDISQAVTKIVVNVTNADYRMGGIKLYVKNADGEIVETIEISAKEVQNGGDITFRIAQPTENCTYELEFDTSTTGGSTNGYIEVASVSVYGYAED